MKRNCCCAATIMGAGLAMAAMPLLDFEEAAEAKIKVLADGSQGVAFATNVCATSGTRGLWMGPKDWQVTAGDFGFAELHWTDRAKNDWSRFDRLVFEVTNLSATKHHLVFYLYDGKYEKRRDARFSFEMPAGQTKQIVATLKWKELGVKASDIRALTFVHSGPNVGAIVIDGIRLLAPGDAVPKAARAQAFAATVRDFQREERVYEAKALAAADEKERQRAAAFKKSLERPRTEQNAALMKFKDRLAKSGQDVSSFVVAQASAMQQIRPRDTDFSVLSPAKGVALRLAREEGEGALVAVASPNAKPLKNVRVTVEGEVAETLRVEAETVGYVLADVPTAHGIGYCVPSSTNACGYIRLVRETPLGWYADPILPFLGKTDVQPGDVQSFHVRVHAPEAAEARTYGGQIRVAADGAKDFLIPLSVRVYGFSVGKTSELPLLVTFTPFVQPLSLSWTKEQADAVRNDPEAPVNLWKRHRELWCTTLGEYFLLPTTIYPPRGDEILDFDLIQQAAREGRKAPFIVAPWSTCKGQDEASWRATYLEPLKKRYAQACAAGLGEYAMTYGCDETAPEFFPSVKRALDILKRECPQIPIITTAGNESIAAAAALEKADALCPHVHKWDAKRVAALRAKGQKVWWYVACPDVAPFANLFVENTLSEGRLLMGAQAVREKPDGFLYYAIAKWNQRRPLVKGPFTDWSPHGIRHRNQPAQDGDGVWIYCGPDGVPVPTLRMENFRDGVEDYNYAKTLERLYARHADKSDAWALEAKKMLDVPLSVMESLTNYTDSPDAIYAWRDRMADLIERETAVKPSATGFRFAPNVQPAPVEMKVEGDTLVKLDRDLTVRIVCRAEAEAAAEWAEDHLDLWFKATKSGWFSGVNRPEVTRAPAPAAPIPGGDEAYELAVTPAGVEVRANTLQGVRYALYTLRQTTYAMPRTGRTVEYYAMPAMKVKDAPALKFRAIHLPWGLDDSAVKIEQRIRVAAYLKYNYAVVEPWGAYRSERHPWWGWKEGSMTASKVRHLVKVAKDVGITLCPQIPAFGHASMGITSPGKHAILDAHPEYQPLFEGLNGWNWCLSNPETLKVQFELIDELIELFDHPPYFHVGCDEAAKPNCPVCLASDYRKLVIRHILALHEGLKARGVRMMLWHDMFLKEGDPRWKGFYANGTAETVRAFESFPRDMVICDWFYGKAAKDGKYPTLEHFKKMGFEVVTCPWYENDGTALQGRRARELGLLGILATTWGEGSGKSIGRYVANSIVPAACAGWGTAYAKNPLWKWGYDLDFIRSLRQVGWDMGLEDYEDTGTYQDQIPVRK